MTTGTSNCHIREWIIIVIIGDRPRFIAENISTDMVGKYPMQLFPLNGSIFGAIQHAGFDGEFSAFAVT